MEYCLDIGASPLWCPWNQSPHPVSISISRMNWAREGGRGLEDVPLLATRNDYILFAAWLASLPLQGSILKRYLLTNKEGIVYKYYLLLTSGIKSTFLLNRTSDRGASEKEPQKWGSQLSFPSRTVVTLQITQHTAKSQVPVISGCPNWFTVCHVFCKATEAWLEQIIQQGEESLNPFPACHFSFQIVSAHP